MDVVTTRRALVEIEPFSDRHVPAAADLVAARFRRELAANPLLPPSQAEAGTHRAVLERLAGKGTGFVALRNGALVGFQVAWLLDGRGGPWAYCPDPGHAAIDDDPRINVVLYARLAADLVARDCLEHVIVVPATDTPTFDAFVHLGFGLLVVDLVRDLSPVPATVDPGVSIRIAGVEDVAGFVALEDGLRAHLAASPTFQPAPPRPLEEQLRRLADPARATFLAEDGAGEPIAYLRIGPCSSDVAMIVQDPSTASITGAFTVAERRGEDVATVLLDRAIAWARDNGFSRCAVDHESANLEASRFWPRHFTPAAFGLVRRLRLEPPTVTVARETPDG